jgi:hypothetical protein
MIGISHSVRGELVEPLAQTLRQAQGERMPMIAISKTRALARNRLLEAADGVDVLVWSL